MDYKSKLMKLIIFVLWVLVECKWLKYGVKVFFYICYYNFESSSVVRVRVEVLGFEWF